MFKIVAQTLAVNTIDFSAVDLHKIDKHTYVLEAPIKTDRRGIVFKFQRGRIPRPDDVIHITHLVDDVSRAGFNRQIVAIQVKHAGYNLRMSCPPQLRLDTHKDGGYLIGYAVRTEGNSRIMLNQHALSW